MDTSRVPPRSAEGDSTSAEECVSFGSYTLWPRARVLHDQLGPVPLGGRALDLLIVLVRHAGEIIPKEQLMHAVWPDVSVGDGNLRVHITALRKALGSGDQDARYIINVAGRGYSFVAPISRRVPLVLVERREERALARTNVIGRDELIASLVTRLQQPALITLVGAGGMGKTTVAREVARELLRGGPRAVHWVDLSHVADDAAVAEACALALGVKRPGNDSLAALVMSLQAKPGVLVLDCCERAVRGVALLVEPLLDELPQLAILATSREALRARGEEVFRLPPLSLPAEGEHLTESTAHDYSAIRLFVERARSFGASFRSGDDELRTVARLCQRLDGIPLAIELAAGHLVAFGLADLVSILERRLTLAGVGRRTAEPRHQTMQDTLDWSYGLLSESERLLMQRLSVFEGATSLRAILSVAAFTPLTEASVLHAVAGLVDKSLLATTTSPTGVAYRLLDTTRAYASNRLAEGAEGHHLARRLALFMLEELTSARRIEGSKPLAEAWLGACCPNFSNLRVAVSWASEADAPLGLELIGAAAPLLMQLSLHAECERLAAQGLRLLRDVPDASSELEMRLAAFGGAATLVTRGPVEDARTALESALRVAHDRKDVHYQGLVLSGLFWLWIYRGEAARAIECAKTISTIDEEPDDSAACISANYIAMATTELGDQALARTLLARAVERKSTHVNLGRFMRVGSDPGIFTQVFRIKTLWLMGEPAQALSLYGECAAVLRAPEHVLYNCWALNEVLIPLHCERQAWAAARDASVELQQAAAEQSMTIRLHTARAAALAIELLQGRGDSVAYDRELEQLRASQFNTLLPWLDGVKTRVLAQQGRVADALAYLENALDANRRATNLWWLAELMRLRAELLDRAQPEAPVSAGLVAVRAAYALASEQGSLLLARRAAESWVTLARQSHDAAQARAALRTTLEHSP